MEPLDEEEPIKTPIIERTIEQQRQLVRHYKTIFKDSLPILCNPEKPLSLNKKLFIVKRDSPLSFMIQHIRKQVKLKPEEGLFIFIRVDGLKGSIIPNPQQTIKELYNKYTDGESFLILDICLQNVFGYKPPLLKIEMNKKLKELVKRPQVQGDSHDLVPQ